MKNNLTIEELLLKLKTLKRFKRDGDLADWLGVKINVLSNWKQRNTFDFDVILNKCQQDKISLDWLFDTTAEYDKNEREKIMLSVIAEQQKTIDKLVNKL